MAEVSFFWLTNEFELSGKFMNQLLEKKSAIIKNKKISGFDYFLWICEFYYFCEILILAAISYILITNFPQFDA